MRADETSGMQLGRCHQCHGKPAFAWKKGAMMLGDAHCPRCGSRLSQTTREVRGGFRLMDAGQVLVSLDKSQAKAVETMVLASESLAAWKADPSADEYRVSLAESWVKRSEAEYERVQKLRVKAETEMRAA